MRFSMAGEEDVALVLSFICKLAEYEERLDTVTATEESLRQALFGERRVAEVVLAYEGDVAVGFAVFFHNFSTFRGQRGMYLEDLFVELAHRGKGIGRSLLAHLAKLAVERGCWRLEWSVLNWNESAIRFYEKLGAEPVTEWDVYQLTGEALERLAAG